MPTLRIDTHEVLLSTSRQTLLSQLPENLTDSMLTAVHGKAGKFPVVHCGVVRWHVCTR
jgi:hypothetical protein